MNEKELLGLRITCNVNAGDREFMEDAVRIHFEEVVKGSVAFAFICAVSRYGRWSRPMYFTVIWLCSGPCHG